jgi:hypothetical protein
MIKLFGDTFKGNFETVESLMIEELKHGIYCKEEV